MQSKLRMNETAHRTTAIKMPFFVFTFSTSIRFSINKDVRWLCSPHYATAVGGFSVGRLFRKFP